MPLGPEDLAHLIGLTATPSAHTLGFFCNNLVAEYPSEQSVVDGVNVGFEVFRIKTRVTDKVTDAGFDLKQSEKRVTSFKESIEANKNELLALRILYSQPFPKRRLTYASIRDYLAANVEIAPADLMKDQPFTAWGDVVAALFGAELNGMLDVLSEALALNLAGRGRGADHEAKPIRQNPAHQHDRACLRQCTG